MHANICPLTSQNFTFHKSSERKCEILKGVDSSEAAYKVRTVRMSDISDIGKMVGNKRIIFFVHVFTLRIWKQH